jgi:hypothetical protein
MDKLTHFFIGGEFWDDPSFDTDHVTVPTIGMVFLNGGEAALRVICDHLISKGIHQILLPSYICSTMADAFDRYGIEYTFYLIGDDFRIDLADLLEKASMFRVIYAINYFGYGFSAEELVVFEQLKVRGFLLIEDDAQAGLNRIAVGQIHFNSLRKMVPLDGSFFFSDRDMTASLEKFSGLPNQRLPVIRLFRQTFARLLETGADSFEELNPIFDQSELYYYQDLTVMGDPLEQARAVRLDWATIESVRKANYARLRDLLADLPGIDIIFPKVSPDGPPLGFPVYIRDGKRDTLLRYLRENHVYPVVHWDITGDPRLNHIPQSLRMSRQILTLFIDQRFNLADMEYQAGILRSFFS